MSGPSLAKMAWRNLWRNRRRTLITASSLAFGVLLATLFTGLSDRRWQEVIDQAARMGAGHVSIQNPDYLDNPLLKNTVRDYAYLVSTIRADPAIEKIVPRIAGQLMIATAAQSMGAAFVALDPTMEDEQSFAFMKGVKSGRLFTSARDQGIIIGQKLAENLGATMGHKVVYTLTDKHGEVVTALARVTGFLKTGVPSVDAALVLLPIDAVREVLGYGPDESTQVAVFVDDHRHIPQVVARLEKQLAGRAAVVPWQKMQPDLAAFITVKVSGLSIMELFILVLIGAGIFNTLFVSVMERLREFGILLAIGFSPGRLFRLVIWESVWLAVVGIVGGVAITALPYYLMNTRGLDISGATGGGNIEVAGAAMEPIMRVAIYPSSALVIILVIVCATIVSGLYPAYRAARVAPVDAIKMV